MKKIKLTNLKVFRLLALLLCLAATVPQMHAAMYIVGGDFDGGWVTNQGTEMTLDNNTGLYTVVHHISNNGYFCFATGRTSGSQDWTSFQTNYRRGPQNDGTEVGIGTTTTAHAYVGNSYKFTGSGGDYEFVYNASNDQFRIDHRYYVLGSNSTLWANGWSTSPAESQKMTNHGNGTWTWTASNVSLSAGTITCKAYGTNGTWYGNTSNNGDLSINVPSTGNYDLTITFNGSRVSYTLEPVSSSVSYFITGDNGLGLDGWSFAPTITMNYDANNDVYTYSYNVTSAGTYYFAFADGAGSSWDDFNGNHRIAPTSGNETVTLGSWANTQKGSGSYVVTVDAGQVTITLDAADNNNMRYKVDGTAPVVVHDYFVKGADTNIFPDGWSTSSNTAQMTDPDEDGIYTWNSDQFHLNVGTNYEYKVYCSNDTWYPTSGNLNFNANIPGTYTVTVSFDSNNETVSATLNLIQPDPTYTYNIYVRYKGSEDLANVHLHAWDANGDKTTWPGLAFSNMQSTEINGHTYYTISYTGYASTMGVLFNENGSVQTADKSLQPGDSYFTYWGGDSVVGPNDQADPAIAYYVVGDDTNIFPNEWGFGNGTVMTDEDEDGIYTWTSAQVHLNPGTYYEYKVRDNEDGWYPENSGNQTFNVNVPGTYTVTVTYDSNTGTVTATTTLVAPDPISTVYVIGNANTQQWAANAGIAMEYDDETGYYSLKNVVLTAMSHFAFATILGNNSEDWTTLNANRLSSNGDSHWAINDGWLNQWMSTQNYVNDNHNWYVEQSGAYDIDFNPSTREVRVKRSHSNLYISYGVNWTYENNSLEMTTVDGNIYQATITLTEGDYFLFSTGLSDETAIGATTGGYEISNLMIGFAQRLESGINNFHFTGSTGKYIVVVNIEKNTVTLRKTADVTVTKIFLQKTSNVTLDPAGGTYQGQTLEGKRGGIYAWNKLNTEMMGGTYQISQDGPTNYTYEGEVMIDGQSYGGNNYLKDLPDTTTADGKQWYAWSVSNSICEFYFIRNNQTDLKSQKIMRRAGEVWLIWVDKDATYNRQDNAVECDSLQDVTSLYYDVTASGVSDCSTMLEDHYYVYYTNTTGWDSVYCYAWYGKGGQFIEFNGAYPGAKCTFVGYDEDGYEVWCYDFGLMEDFHRIYGKDENDEYIIPTNVIFDNGKGGSNTGAEGDTEREQTGDLPFDNGACYDYLGMVYLGNSLNGIINTGIVNGPKYTVEDNLVGVYYDENALTRIYETDLSGNPLLDDQGNPKFIDVTGALYAKDFENYSAKSKMPEGTTDYVYDICAHVPNETYPGGSQIQIKRDSYDQSNWVKIVLSPNFDNVHLQNTDVTYDRDKFDEEDFESATDVNRPTPYLEQYVGKIIPGGSMSGNLVNSVNPQMHITNIAKPLAMEKAYEPNVYVTGHFNDTVVFSYVHQDWNPDFYEGVYRTVPHMATDENNQTYVDYVTVDYSHLYKMFYVAPKPQEVAYITWAVFDHDIKTLGTDYYQGGEPSDPGAFYAPMNWNRTGELWDGTGFDPEDPDAVDPNAPWGTTYGPYSNGYMQYGAFQVNWSLFEGMEIPASDPNRPQKPWYQIFKPGQAYKILAVIRYAYGATPDEVEYSAGVYQGSEYNDGDTGHDHVCNAPRRANDTWDDMQHVPYNNLDQSKFIIFPLRGSDADSNGDGLGNVTTVKEVTTARTVVAVRYYNLTGAESEKPFDGLNIVVTTYSDGSRTSKKILR